MQEPRIKILDNDTISKIAAGEVVERPASVVKELIENSIDAVADRITVEVKDAGRTLIRVTDNGSGMSRQDAALSIERHSTSKINSPSDLFKISTLGFRGEALPSIASISKFEMVTKQRGSGAVAGTRIRVEGGRAGKIEDFGAPDGTAVAVEDIFYSTPARKKFLKSDATELSHIVEIVSKYVLAYPSVSFELFANGAKLVFSPGSGSYHDAFTAIYGADAAGNSVEVKYSSGHVDVSGFVVRPTVTRVDRDMQSFFVNGRHVKNYLLSRGLENAFRTLIPRDRYPLAAIFIKIDPKEVDVNVHPTKREVKFLKTSEVLSAVRDAVAASLDLRSHDFEEATLSAPQGSLPSFSGVARALFDPSLKEQWSDLDKVYDPEGGRPHFFQILNTYIVLPEKEGFLLIDQHAAHERVLFDEIRLASSGPAGTKGQDLLVKESIELSRSDAVILKDNLQYLKDAGFEIEEFGSETFRLMTVPAQLAGSSPKQVLLDIIAELKDHGGSTKKEERLEAVQKLVACHSAVKAGEALSEDEMASLTERLNKTANPLTCPHGRPTMVKFSKLDLEKIFKRV